MRWLKISILLWLLTMITAFAAAPPMPCDEAIVQKMFAMYRLDTSTYRIEVLSNRLKTPTVSPDDITIYPLTQKEPLGLFSVNVKVWDGGKEVESGQVRMKIKQFAEVLTVAEKIRSHEPLSADKLTLRRMEVTNLHERPLQDITEIEGYRARRNLRRGMILTAAAIEPIPDIEAGKEVSIVYVNGLCRITAVGVALQTGMAGDYVKVKNKGSGKIILARVVDGSVVAVDP